MTNLPPMKRRTLLALPAMLLALAARMRGARAQGARATVPLTAQDQTDIARVQAYLNSLRSLKARFLQVASNGSTAQGVAWLVRPGRMRFQYDPPSPLLLVANYGSVVFRDKQLNQTSNIPLSSTPLGILLADHVTLSADVTVTGITRQPGQLQMTLVRTSSPGDGSLTLVFAEMPLTLKQWSVIDGQRQETRVSLFDVELGGTFDPSLFNVADVPPSNPTPQN